MDDIRPPRNTGQTTPPTNYGRVPSQQPQMNDVSYGQTQPVEQHVDYASDHHDQNFTLPEHHKSGKGTKVALVLFILLFIGASVFAGWEYMQIKDLKEDVAELQKENDRLNERVYSLNYDNKDLAQKLELANSEIEALQEENEKLQEACGSTCDNITP